MPWCIFQLLCRLMPDAYTDEMPWPKNEFYFDLKIQQSKSTWGYAKSNCYTVKKYNYLWKTVSFSNKLLHKSFYKSTMSDDIYAEAHRVSMQRHRLSIQAHTVSMHTHMYKCCGTHIMKVSIIHTECQLPVTMGERVSYIYFCPFTP
jgi:hypothetical protein